MIRPPGTRSRLLVAPRCVVPDALEDDGFGGRRLRALRKGVKPPSGYDPVPGGNSGGYRKKHGVGYDYWYPTHAARQQAAHHHQVLAAEHDRLSREAARGRKWKLSNHHTMEAADHHHASLSAHANAPSTDFPSGGAVTVAEDATEAGALGKRVQGAQALLDKHRAAATRPGAPEHVSGPWFEAAGHLESYEQHASHPDGGWHHEMAGRLLHRAEQHLGDLDKRLKPMMKAVTVPADQAAYMVDLADAGQGKFKVGGYNCRFSKSGRGIPILSITGGKLAMAYHMVVRSFQDAISRAPQAARDFDEGRVPHEGVFRREATA